ncbi:MAG: YlmC/YmxH family sporulation protein [Chitinophagales bacterium]
MLARISDLRLREVISVLDGRRLGYIDDLEVDVATGQVTAIVLPNKARFWQVLTRNEDICIPWSQIRRIGADVILVEPTYLVDRHPDRERE